MTKSQIWRSFGRLSAGREKGVNGGKGSGIKKYKLVGTKQPGNYIGNGVAKELICMLHGHELRGGLLERMGVPSRGEKRRKHWNNCNNIINKIYIFKNATKEKYRVPQQEAQSMFIKI